MVAMAAAWEASAAAVGAAQQVGAMAVSMAVEAMVAG